MRLGAAARGRRRSRASSGRTSSATRRRCSASRRSSSWRVHRADVAGALSTARDTSTTACARSSTSCSRTSIVEDNVVVFPGAPRRPARPWVRIVSCNPLEVRIRTSRPVFSGYRRGPLRVGRVPRRVRPDDADFTWEFRAFCRSAARPTARPRVHARVDWLNLYVYPAEADYPRSPARRRHGTGWTRASAATDAASSCRPAGRRRRRARLPLAGQPRLGRCRPDAAARRRLADAPHRFIVSKGPQHTSTSWPTTCGAPSSCRNRRCCRWPTWSSPTAATTRRRSASTSASR